ncbi:MAG: NAD(P)H-dependent oxidoreductase subunit E [Planctomycetota bacterium]|jgi:[NiFe] hydrogenase diaphorase moiety large subunit
MSTPQETAVRAICRDQDGDPIRLLDIAREVQRRYRCVSEEAMSVIADELSIPSVEVRSLVSFYAFLTEEPQGEVVIRLSDDVIDRLRGYQRVADVFREELGIDIGETTADGRFTLTRTACIGMSDQAPAALVNDVVVTELSTDQAREIVRELREHGDPRRLVKTLGDGNNAHDLVQSMVRNHVRMPGPNIFKQIERQGAVKKALGMHPVEVIRALKTARLRGRGGAGFPTGMKWEFARAAEGERKYIVCNADEGEPGTFKDRVLLTEKVDRVFAGMTIAGFAIGAEEGILYLRAEYEYLKPYLEWMLARRRRDRLLGDEIWGRRSASFDIRIQMGAGAYVCGEETALLSSCEGRRGDPRNRPPFPAQHGYRGFPTVVNNVETLVCVTKILADGPATFASVGTEQSTGTKLLSVSGDCRRPGVFEVPFGISLHEILGLAGAPDAGAVQVGGPSGEMVAPDGFFRQFSFEDLSTGGSVMIFGKDRDPLEIAEAFLEFFEDESCGYCTPCRVGNGLLRRGLRRIRDGRGEPADLDLLEQIGETMKGLSRCGLGQTSANPVLSTLRNFRPRYEDLVEEDPDGFRRSFDLEAATEEARAIRRAGR